MFLQTDFVVFSGSVPMQSLSLTATSSPKHLSTPLYPSMYVGNTETEYMITTRGNNLIMLQVRTYSYL